MKKAEIAVIVAVIAAAGVAVADGKDGKGGKDGDSVRVGEFLLGAKEVPVVSTTGFGTFSAKVDRDETRIEYKLTFQKLEGDVRQSHIHIGPKGNTGGIVLWLCQTPDNPAPATTDPPQCFDDADPATLRSNTVKGVLTAADVIPQPGNGIEAGELDEVINLMRAGKTYVNVHSSKFPPGEIRSQIDDDHDHGKGDDRGKDDRKDGDRHR